MTVSLRAIIITVMQNIVGVKILNCLFAWDDDSLPYIVFLSKILFMHFLELFLTSYGLSDQLVYYSNSVMFIGIVTLFSYHYKEDVLKIVMGIQFGDIMVYVLSIPVIALINLLERRSALIVYTYSFVWLDFLFIPLLAIIGYLFLKFAGHWLRRFHYYRLGHREVWFLFVIIYSIIIVIVPIMMTSKNFDVSLQIMFGMLVIPVIFIIYYLFSAYNRKIKREEEYLKSCLQLMGSKHIALHNQLELIENQKALLDNQMMKLMELNSVESELVQKKIDGYLQELRNQYQYFQSGIYCDDWIVDAVLSEKVKEAEKDQISVQIHLQNYKRENVSEFIVAMILYNILSYGIEELKGATVDKEIVIHLGKVQNQLVIRCVLPTTGKIRKIKRRLMELVRSCDGLMKVEKKRGQIIFSVSITDGKKV